MDEVESISTTKPNANEKPVPDRVEVKAEDHSLSHTVFATVYANEIAHSAMLTEGTPLFPVGSIIVREKLLSRESTEPELLTVMVKRAKGFNPDAGDWEFAVVDGAAVQTRFRQKVGDCQACHVSQKEDDYVFRTYLRKGVILIQK